MKRLSLRSDGREKTVALATITDGTALYGYIEVGRLLRFAAGQGRGRPMSFCYPEQGGSFFCSM
jgi:ABC-type Fe3+ transport system substrate-binding protein